MANLNLKGNYFFFRTACISCSTRKYWISSPHRASTSLLSCKHSHNGNVNMNYSSSKLIRSRGALHEMLRCRMLRQAPSFNLTELRHWQDGVAGCCVNLDIMLLSYILVIWWISPLRASILAVIFPALWWFLTELPRTSLQLLQICRHCASPYKSG